MNGKNYNDFKMATVRPEPVEGCLPIFLQELNSAEHQPQRSKP